MPQVRVLTCHTGYRCQHAGACCTSNWPIPVEADRLARLRAALASGRLQSAAGSVATALTHANDAPASADGTALLGRTERSCVFYDSSPAVRTGRCRIHSALGHDALPLACRQFPRVSVVDPRGVAVTLSHYCPTAAAMIDASDDAPLGVAVDAPAFPTDAEYVGLDARESLPPLVRRDLLMDWEAWWECERLAVALFSADVGAATAVAQLRAAAIDIRAWSPSEGPLITRVREAFANAQHARVSIASGGNSGWVDAVFAAIPSDIRPARFEAAVSTREPAARRFLASHAFANWSVHLGTGLSAWVGSVEAAWALLDAGAGVRQADLLLRHLADPAELARRVA